MSRSVTTKTSIKGCEEVRLEWEGECGREDEDGQKHLDKDNMLYAMRDFRHSVPRIALKRVRVFGSIMMPRLVFERLLPVASVLLP